MTQTLNGIVVKKDNVVKGVYHVNDETHLKHINDQLTRHGYSVWRCNVVDDNGSLSVSGDLHGFKAEAVAPKPFERLVESNKLPSSPDFVLSTVYDKLLKSPDGINKTDIWDMVNQVLTTMPAFTLRMKRLLADKPHELVKDGNIYKLVDKQAKTE